MQEKTVKHKNDRSHMHYDFNVTASLAIHVFESHFNKFNK